MPDVRHKRGTRAALDALAAGGGLQDGQVYVITDEAGRIAMATSESTYTAFVRDTEDVSKWPFFEVRSFGQPAGANNGFFPTFNFNNAGATTDTHRAWNQDLAYYTVPQTGVYDIMFKLRPADYIADNKGYGTGVGTENGDSPNFSWWETGGALRHGSAYRRISGFNQGDVLRAFTYDIDFATSGEALVIVRIR